MNAKSMDVFSLRDAVVDEYRQFATSLATIHADDIRTQVEAICAEGRFWPGATRDRLRGHLRPGLRVAAWLWVASGKVHFIVTEKTQRRLDQYGIRFVGNRLRRKHLGNL